MLSTNTILAADLTVKTQTVTEINRQIKNLLEDKVGEIFVLGEISNCTKAGSGHLYFTLKDAKAQLRCAWFRNTRQANLNHFQNGQQVIARGRLSLYEPRGDYQLIVQDLTAAGLGALYQQFEELKKKLHQQGYFDTARKKALPRFPQKIGIITSLSGAALHDIASTLKRRYPLASLHIYPSEVQGKHAAAYLIRSLNRASASKELDVLILARGGGSIEDLWSFNDENLAYAISACPIPVVSGVGHETDITIADFVADLRSATPTAAAEAVSPDKNDLFALIQTCSLRLNQLMQSRLKQVFLHFSQVEARLHSPEPLILSRSQTVDYLEKQMKQALQQKLQQLKHRYLILDKRLQTINLAWRIKNLQESIFQTKKLLNSLLFNKINGLSQNYLCLAATLAALNPLSILERGFAIVSLNGRILANVNEVHVKDTIQLRFAKGELHCEVLKKISEDNKNG